MPLRAASSIISYVGPDHCVHTREVANATAESPEPTVAQLRSWAKAHDIDLPAKGKVPQDVVDAYKASVPAVAATIEYSPDFVVDCAPCEKTLKGHELWGAVNEPAPLTKDEERQQKAQEKAANLNILQGLAALPEMAKLLAQLAGQNKAQG